VTCGGEVGLLGLAPWIVDPLGDLVGLSQR
jgi:hypothetical protein